MPCIRELCHLSPRTSPYLYIWFTVYRLLQRAIKPLFVRFIKTTQHRKLSLFLQFLEVVMGVVWSYFYTAILKRMFLWNQTTHYSSLRCKKEQEEIKGGLKLCEIRKTMYEAIRWVSGTGEITVRFNCLHYTSLLLHHSNLPITCHFLNDLLFMAT